jgi:surface protein
MEENYKFSDLETFIIKDKTYKKKRKLKLLLIIIPIILIIIISIVALSIILSQNGGEINCIYQTLEEKENIALINSKNNIKFSLIIDEIEYEQKNYHLFEIAGLHKITFKFKRNLISLDQMFDGINNLIEIDFSKLHLEDLESTKNTFSKCRNLRKVNFENKTPKLKKINGMFEGCLSLESLNLDIDTSKVVNMSEMFRDCNKLKILDLSHFKFESVNDMEFMFLRCTNLTEIIFNNNTKTDSLVNASYIFEDCFSLKNINMKIFNANNILRFSYTFHNCYSLEEIDFSNFETKNLVQLNNTFNNCSSLKKIEIKFNTSKLESISKIFYNCTSLTSVDISTIRTDKMLIADSAFRNCIKLTSLDLLLILYNKYRY